MVDFVASPYALVVLVAAAFAMPLIYVAWIRNTPRYRREPLRTVLWVFGWGAFVSAVIALILEVVFIAAALQFQPLYEYLANRFSSVDPGTVLGVLIIAPLVEEAAKALGVRSARSKVRAVPDGLVYGAAAGLGFSAMENLLYGLSSFAQPCVVLADALVLIVVRSFSSPLLHASATATTGYGLAKSWIFRRHAYLPFYRLAVLMHAAFNSLDFFGQLNAQGFGGLAQYVSFFVAVTFAIIAITVIRFKLLQRRPSKVG